MKILISGATGTLGHGLSKYLESSNKFEIIRHGLKNQSDFQLDFTNKNTLINFLDYLKPNYIVNLVCLSNVDECEKNLKKAYLYNSEVVKFISFWAKYNNCKIIHISTDQVYDKINYFNKEDDVNIKNNYALSKLEGEKHLSVENSCILRTNFFGNSNSKKTLNEWLLDSIKNNKQINLFSDIKFNPVSMNTLYRLIDHIICNFKGGLYNFGAKNGISKADFCFQIMKKFDIHYDKINILSVEHSDLFAYRPKGMVMNTQKFANTFNFKIPKIEDEIFSLPKENIYQNENK